MSPEEKRIAVVEVILQLAKSMAVNNPKLKNGCALFVREITDNVIDVSAEDTEKIISELNRLNIISRPPFKPDLFSLRIKDVQEYKKKLNDVIKRQNPRPNNYRKKIPDKTIKEMVCVQPKNDSSDFWIIVNANYSKPLRVSKNIKCWDLLFRIAEGEKIPFDKNFTDYFNSNDKNKIYTQTGLSLTKVFRSGGKEITADNVKIKIISSKAFKTQSNKQVPA